ncbi:hypothetical protein P168DRAFT_170277 [Aspergillus campestris IBT 28561]|uniref:Uncharacterized protein n=1 Tax=Aspergillus campestris (strain IBT 28561) TaxID=1392248 RepID=A0A2I1D1U8_ASPC2|nr:uncharacterized protein P168DRAFT_170277 [Aspergillus campestris IBT 28561]PKY03837.1 hypothetical protein P168DRAFT_170277 [Aspergillus campestris IBT 28561]
MIVLFILFCPFFFFSFFQMRTRFGGGPVRFYSQLTMVWGVYVPDCMDSFPFPFSFIYCCRRWSSVRNTLSLSLSFLTVIIIGILVFITIFSTVVAKNLVYRYSGVR